MPLQDLAGSITECLQVWQEGDRAALSRLTALVYQELRRMARAAMARQSGPCTIQPTALVHELYLRLPAVRDMDFRCRGEFLNVAARMMRNILVDRARKRHAAKRGGGLAPLLVDASSEDRALRIDVLLVHNVLDDFAQQYPRQARVVELRFFGGLTAEETSDVLRGSGVESSLRTVERDWNFARAWLQDAIGTEQP